MNKTIEVHRHFNLVEMQQEDPSVKAWLGEAFRPIGPYFETNGRATATGLSFAEQAVLMPVVLGIEKQDKDFRRAVTKYYDEILTNVPKDGLKLNISLENDSKPLSEDNLPIALKDYIIYRHLIGHRDVAKDKTEAQTLPYKRFYVVDPNKVAAESVKINDLEDKAMTLYFRFKDDTIKVDQILTMMGISVKNMKKEQKTLELKKFTTKKPGTPEHVQTELFKRFIDVCEDTDLEYKFLVEELVGAQVLERIGTNILFKESGERLGDDMKEAVLFLKNAKNSKTLNMLKANYQMKVKKGVFESPMITQEKETQQAE